MTDLLSQAQAMVSRMRHSFLTRSITYRRPSTGQSVALSASVGETVFRFDDGVGGTIRTATRDYLIRAEDLLLAGVQTEPQRLDEIDESIGGETRTFLVISPADGEPDWKFSGPDRTDIRLHTRETG